MNYCIRCNRTPVLTAGNTCLGCRPGLEPERHTCGNAESGSERSENTCAACHDERAAYATTQQEDET